MVYCAEQYTQFHRVYVALRICRKPFRAQSGRTTSEPYLANKCMSYGTFLILSHLQVYNFYVRLDENVFRAGSI